MSLVQSEHLNSMIISLKVSMLDGLDTSHSSKRSRVETPNPTRGWGDHILVSECLEGEEGITFYHSNLAFNGKNV